MRPESDAKSARYAAWLGLAVLALVIVVDVGYVTAVALTREPAAKPLTGDRIFHATRPAVVLVQSDYSVKASVPDADLPPARVQDIENQLLAMVRAGKLAPNEKAIDQAAFDIIAANPDAYFAPSDTRIDDSRDMVNSGTGFFVTEDGYLVTASHVVSADQADLRTEILDLDKRPENVSKVRADLKASIALDGLTVSDSDLDRLTGWWQTWEAQYISVDSIEAKYYIQGGANVAAGDALTSTGTRASLISAEQVFPGRDVALLKANVSSVPALRLAAADPKRGEPDYVVAYPRKGYLQEPAAFNATVPVVLSDGSVRAEVSRGDWSAYGTDADVTHGASGGPVLNSRGDVLGVVSFGTPDGSGSAAQNYFVPSGVVRQLMNKAGVMPKPGTGTASYYRALQLGDERRYRDEVPVLQTLVNRFPDDAYVKEDMSMAEGALLSGADRTPPELLPYAPPATGALAGALALNLGILLAGVAARRRRPVAVEAEAIPLEVAAAP